MDNNTLTDTLAKEDAQFLVEVNTDFSPEELKQIKTIKDSIDFSNSQKIIQYGGATQNRMSTFADSILNSVKARDISTVGTLLIELTTEVKQFDKSAQGKGFFFGLFYGIKKKISVLQARFSTVDANIRRIATQLESHNQQLLKDIYILDNQYKENWNYYRELTLFIEAGDQKIQEMKQEVLPQMKLEAQASNDQRKIQEYKDFEDQIIRFEKKIHDLRLSRTISIQMAPQIRMVQNNSSTMIDKIQSTLTNTLPLWKNQMVLALGIAHTQQALDSQRAVTDATNDLLRKNSEMLHQTTTQIARESERGIVDIETIKHANAQLFKTIEDVLRIQVEGREQRIAAEVELKAIEVELKNKLVNSQTI